MIVAMVNASSAPPARHSTAVALYLAVLLSPVWFPATWLGLQSGRVRGYMRNTDCVAVKVVDTNTGQTWTVGPGNTVAMNRGVYRLGSRNVASEFDPANTVLATSLTWDFNRDGLQSEHQRGVFDFMGQTFVVVVVVLIVVAMWLSRPSHSEGAKQART